MREFIAVILALGFAFAGAEAGCRYYHYRHCARYEGRDHGELTRVFERDSALGIALKPGMRVELRAFRARTPLYRAQVTIDDKGRRFTPNHDQARDAALFFGCSFTFGLGVDDDQTLPADFEGTQTGLRALNYGLPGAGPQNMLAQLQKPGLASETGPASLAVYTFIDDHVGRAVGSPMVYFGLGKFLPYYHQGPGNRLVRDGDFVSGRPWVSTAFNLLEKSYLFFYAARDLRPPDAPDLEMTARIIEAARDRYREVFHNSNFYVLIYPGARHFGPALAARLTRTGTRVLDYSTLDFHDSKYWLPGDWHPSTEAYREIARRLSEDLAHPHVHDAER